MSNTKPLISFDYAIKYLIRDKKDYEIVEGFISALLGTIGYGKVKIIGVLETESNKEQKKAKRSVADLVVEDEKHNKYIVEIERNYKDTFIHKACFNTSRLIIDNLSTDQNYNEILKVFHISLLYFDINNHVPKHMTPRTDGGVIYHGKTIIHDIDNKELLSVHMKNPDTDEVFDAVNILPEYLFISVPGFNDKLEREIDDWLYVMKYDEVPEHYHSPYMQKVADRLSVLKMTDEERSAYYHYQKQLHNDRDELVAARNEGREEGREEGIQIGEAKGVKKTAINMLKENADINFISTVTGFSKEQILKLKNNESVINFV